MRVYEGGGPMRQMRRFKEGVQGHYAVDACPPFKIG
jgi:hypothetical protein